MSNLNTTTTTVQQSAQQGDNAMTRSTVHAPAAYVWLLRDVADKAARKAHAALLSSVKAEARAAGVQPYGSVALNYSGYEYPVTPEVHPMIAPNIPGIRARAGTL